MYENARVDRFLQFMQRKDLFQDLVPKNSLPLSLKVVNKTQCKSKLKEVLFKILNTGESDD